MTLVNSPDVLVIGGYGAVGSVVCARLARSVPGRVVPAGRSLAAAQEVARRIGSTRAVRVDLADPATLDAALDGVGLVVLAVEPGDDRVARACFVRGVSLVDVSASRGQLEATELLDEVAREAGAAAVLSVGVAPGLTNLLARRAHDLVGGAQEIDVAVVLGGGEAHGADAIRWTVDGLVGPRSDGDPRRVLLPGLGRRTVHPFDFSDQHSLRRTLGVPRVTTRFALDSRAITASLFGARRSGVLRAFRGARARRVLAAVFGAVHLGGDRFALAATACNGARTAQVSLVASGQGRVTGLVAAEVALAVLAGRVPPGVRHVEQVDGLADLPERLAAAGGAAAVGLFVDGVAAQSPAVVPVPRELHIASQSSHAGPGGRSWEAAVAGADADAAACARPASTTPR
ncbi:saccharopine dehydrogenase family protein [Oerskovia enterophila]